MSRLLRVRDALRRAFRGAGWAGAAGGLLLALAVAVDQQAASDIETRRAALAAERAVLLGGETPVRAAPAGIDRQTLQAFYQGFPPRSELPALLAALQVQAETHGIDVDRSDYRVSEETGAPLLRVVLSLPVRAEYGALYGWLSELIATAPHVALESLALRRADARSGFVEGELRLLVFVNRGAP
ncbi:MAG: hypothetical protein ACYC5W_01350 [Thauera sp.]